MEAKGKGAGEAGAGEVPWAQVKRVEGTVVRGHRVASGLNGNPRFPGGTLRMQVPFFLERGLDLRGFYLGTLNVDVRPRGVRPVRARSTVRGLKWHPEDPAEDFSFFDVRMRFGGAEGAEGGGGDGREVEGFIYYPHPETKPTHFQEGSVLELLLPYTEGLEYGERVWLEVPQEQMIFPEARGRDLGAWG